MLTLLVAWLAAPASHEHLDEWRAYSATFAGVGDSFEGFVLAMEQSAKLAAGANVTCADCYKIHGGESGDCSSVFGCECSRDSNPPPPPLLRPSLVTLGASRIMLHST